MRMWCSTDFDGRICATTDRNEFADGMAEFDFPDDFDFATQDEWRVVGGKLVHDPPPPTASELAATRARSEGSQASAFVRSLVAQRSASMGRREAMAVSLLLPEWSGEGVAYEAEQWVLYAGDAWEVAQAHTSQPGWAPDQAPSLFSRFELAADGVRVWRQPTGAHDCWDAGERCRYPDAAGALYESVIDGNVWSPEDNPSGWEEVVEGAG